MIAPWKTRLRERDRWCGIVAATVASAALLQPAHAADSSVELLRQLRAQHAGTQIDAVAATPVAGLFAVTMGTNVAYVIEGQTRFFLFGHLFDTEAMRDLTPAPAATTTPVAWSALQQSDALVIVNGDGQRQLAVFTDPLCQYCRRLDAELNALKNVRISLFIVPFQGRETPLSIWCSADRPAAWRSAMRGESLLEASRVADCANPLDRNLALARSHGITGTPTIIFPDGAIQVGAASAAEIEAVLSRQSKLE